MFYVRTQYDIIVQTILTYLQTNIVLISFEK